MLVDTGSIAANVAAVRTRIAEAALGAGRRPSDVTLVAVSKTFPPACVEAAFQAGLRRFGENRVQEAEEKIPATRVEGAVWHLIGHLQTNKARTAARLFAIVESVDSRRLAEALSRELVKLDREIDVLLEVNVAGEESKFGFSPDDVLAEASAIAHLPGLRVVGLMTVAPIAEDPETVRPVFRGLRELGERVRPLVGSPAVWHLSMGMSNDYPIAIAEGATIVRVGRAIFGAR